MKRRTGTAQGVLYTSGAALLYGALPLFAAVAYGAGGNAETLNFYKSAWALPVLAVALLCRRQTLRLPRRTALWLLAAGVLGKGVTSLLLYSSYRYVSAGVATTLHFLYPLFAVLFGRFLLGVRVPRYKWAVLLAATAAVGLVAADGGRGEAAGVLFAVASAVVYAGYILMVERRGVAQVPPLVFAFYLAVSGAAFSLVYGLATGTLVHGLPLEAHGAMAAAAVATSIAGAALLQQGIRRLGAAMAAFFSLLEPVGSCVLGAIFLDERLTGRAAAGIGLILLALTAMLYLDGRAARKEVENRGKTA